MKNPNLKSANAHMSDMLMDLMNAECFVISARLDQFHNNSTQFRYHIQVLNTQELTEWICEHGYGVRCDPKNSRRCSIHFFDGEVFYLV